MFNSRLINTKVAGGGGGCTDIVDNYDPFGDSSGVALYQLNGNATDTGANNLNGSPVNVTYGAGVFGQAGVFNGTSSEINLPNPSNIFNLQEITVSAWINISTMTYGAIYENYSGAHYGTIFWVRENTNALMFIIAIPGTNQLIVESNTVLNLNQWYHVAYTFSSTTGECKIYLNGAQDGYGSVSPGFTITYASGNTPCIGNTSEHGPYVVNGKIDQLRVFNRELNPLEIEALYTEELCICDGTVDTLDILGDGSCIATYQLDGNANDLSGNYSGTPTDVSYGVGEFDLAGVFNGSSGKIELPTNVFSFSSFTLSGWVNVNANTDENTLFEITDSNSYPNHTTIVISAGDQNGNAARFLFRNYLANQFSYRPTGDSSNLGWRHYAMTYDGSTVNCYINGSIVQTGSLSLTNPVGSITGVRLGLSSGSRYLNGSIDQVRIFNKALNSTEVTTLYNETACASKINLDRDPVRHWGLDNTLASTKSGYSALQKTSATYSTGRFGAALNFNRGETASETSTFYGDIWTDVTKANFLQGSVSFWFKPASTNQRNIVTYCEKIPPFGLEFSTGNKLSITSFLDTNTYSPETYGTSDIIFVCITAYRTGGVGSTQTCNFTMYYSSVSENSLKSISNSGTSTDPTNITTFCLGHGASSVGFNGWVDQFRLFDKPLNAEQVQELFDEQPY